jgi:single-strand DNA-binding protein
VLNRVVLVGRLANDPELRYTPNGVAVASFRIAVDRGRPNPDGTREADFFSIVAWQKSAEFAANYLSKGRLIGIDGRLQTRSWVAQDGTKRSVVEVVAENLRALEPRRDGEGGQRSATPTGASSENEEPSAAESDESFDPFADE